VRPLVGFRETFLRDTASERSASTPKAKFTLVECLRFVFFLALGAYLPTCATHPENICCYLHAVSCCRRTVWSKRRG